MCHAWSVGHVPPRASEHSVFQPLTGSQNWGNRTEWDQHFLLLDVAFVLMQPKGQLGSREAILYWRLLLSCRHRLAATPSLSELLQREYQSQGEGPKFLPTERHLHLLVWIVPIAFIC